MIGLLSAENKRKKENAPMKKLISTLLLIGVLLSLGVPAALAANTIYCANCGKQVTADSNFCWSCGSKITVVPDGQEYGLNTASGRPGIEDIRRLGLENSMDLPSPRDYLNSYQTKYVSSWQAQVYSRTTAGKQVCIDTLSNGTKVVVIAQTSSMSCVLYEVSGGTIAGWITTQNLSTKQPEGSTRNSPSGGASLQGSSVSAAAQEGKDYVELCGWLGYVQLPKDSSWLSDYRPKEVKTWKATVYSYTQAGKQKVIETINNGTGVLVLAEQGEMSFVSYESDGICGPVCGWITTANLSEVK